MLESTVTTKGQTTLPKDVRNALGIKPGDRVRFVILNEEVRLIKALPVVELEAMLERPGKAALSLEDMQAAIEAGAIAGSGLER